MLIHRSLMVGLILACTGAIPNVEPAPARAVAFTESRSLSAAVDTLTYKFSWTAGANATGYQVNAYPIAGDVGGWVTSPGFLPIATAVPNVQIKFLNSGMWDSVRFRVVVKSTRGASVSKDSSTVEWWVRKLGAPGPVIVDSSLIFLGMRAVKLPMDSVTYAVCPVVRFYKGGEAVPARYRDEPCATFAAGLTTSVKQQAIADTLTLAITHTDSLGHKLIFPT